MLSLVLVVTGLGMAGAGVGTFQNLTLVLVGVVEHIRDIFAFVGENGMI